MPRNFFDQHVLPNYDEWLAQPLDERRARNAVAEANNMAARVYLHWKDTDRARVFDANSESEYRDALATCECEDFALVRDVADAHKHLTLDRRSRRVSQASQTGVGSLGWGQARWGEGVWGGGPQLVVTLDDSTKRPLTAIMRNVMEMWERLLVGSGL